ncbi:hypothetical protein AOQ84DRAFT_304460, partial [Glonium stellatum]
INHEAKVRRSTKLEVLGTAKVMSYKDLEKAKAARAAKEVAKEAKKAKSETKKVKKEARKVAKEAQKVIAGKRIQGRKRKSPVEADAMEPEAEVSRTSEASELLNFHMGWMSEEQVAPVARMI